MKLPPFLLERFFEKFEFNVPFILAASDCETCSVEDLFRSDPNQISKMMQLRLGYTQPMGDPELRQEIATLYQSQSPSSICVCTGAEEAIFITMNALLKPGDHVIVHYPCYQSLVEIPRAMGCSTSLWQASPENNWEPDLNALEEAITPKTRMVVINFPHNPTGFQISRQKFFQLTDIVKKKDIMLISDEVYRFLEFNPEECLPAAADVYPHAISIGVMSKSFGLAGLRIGWLTAPDHDIINRVSGFKDYTTICNSALSEYLALLALKQKENLIRRNLTIIKENLYHLTDFMLLFQDRLAWVPPKAGSVAFPRFYAKNISNDFYERLAQNQGILLLPGTCFGYPSGFFRIGFGRSNFQEGLDRLAEFFLKNSQKEKTHAEKN